MSAAGRRITVNIDELILHGVDRKDAGRLAESIRTELAAVLAAAAAGWAPDARAGVARLDAGSVTISPGSAPEVAGQAVARRIGAALSRPVREEGRS
jgi:hypothetical protein